MRVRFSRQARGDLKSIVEKITEHNPQAAERMRRLLSEKAFSLSEHPERGARLIGHPTARRLVVRPYLIIYRLDPTMVRILRILHGKRDIGALLTGESKPGPDQED